MAPQLHTCSFPRVRARARAVLAVALLALLVGAATADAAARVGAVGPDVLVRPMDSPTVSATAHVMSARNEFESVQVVIRADGAPLTGVDVSVTGTLTAPGGATIEPSAFTTYRVGYYDVTGLPSDGDLGGALGAFPDALVPKVDTFWHEPRRAFPIDVPAGQNRLAWIDVLVPADATPGTYSGASIHVTAAGGVDESIPLELEVVDLTLPSSTSLDGGFDVNPNQLCAAHACASFPGGAAGLTAMYEQVALDDRLTLAKPPTATPSGPTDETYRTYSRPLLTGTANTRLPGAALRTVTIYQWAVDSADEWRRTADADGYADRVRFHCDEIGTSVSAWTACRDDWTRANALWRSAAPTGSSAGDLPLQVTTSVDDIAWARTHGFADFADRIAVLVPVINRVHPKSRAAFPGRRSEFDPFASGSTPGGAARHLWSYTSCMSMGCSPASADPESEWKGWPGYGIDQPGSEARAMGWISWTYGLEGEYYYETARDLPTAWTDQWSDDGGNHGDGTLFYPGTVAKVGGTHDVAIESIRLKRIRDGREDFEWLRVASAAAGRAAVEPIARSAYADAFSTDVPEASIDGARSQLASLVAGRGLRGITPPRRTPTTTTPTTRRVTCGGRVVTILGTARADVLHGTARADVIAGLGGNDRISGLGRGDIICAGDGNDVIVTAGDGAARDLVSCGRGRDRLVRDRRDRVLVGCERASRAR